MGNEKFLKEESKVKGLRVCSYGFKIDGFLQPASGFNRLLKLTNCFCISFSAFASLFLGSGISESLSWAGNSDLFDWILGTC